MNEIVPNNNILNDFEEFTFAKPWELNNDKFYVDASPEEIKSYIKEKLTIQGHKTMTVEEFAKSKLILPDSLNGITLTIKSIEAYVDQALAEEKHSAWMEGYHAGQASNPNTVSKGSGEAKAAH